MNYEEILVVPDTHFRPFWRKVLNTNLPVVFLGDYLDPYWPDTYEKGFNEFLDIIEFAKENPDNVTLILADHEAHYVDLSNDCARFDYEHAPIIHKVLKENEQLFTGAFIYNNAIFTHAGVSLTWLNNHNIKEHPVIVANYINRQIKFSDEPSCPSPWGSDYSVKAIGDIGRVRGGSCSVGGPLWCDIDEIYHTSAFKDQINQVFGHSQLKNTGSFIHNDNFWMCDSRAVFIWNGKELKLYD